jgi:hypothetical protein
MGSEGSLLCSQGPALRPHVTFYNKLIFTVRSCQPLTQSPSRRTTPYRLSATAYSIYSQLSSISRGCILHLKPKNVPCHEDREIFKRNQALFQKNHHHNLLTFSAMQFIFITYLCKKHRLQNTTELFRC